MAERGGRRRPVLLALLIVAGAAATVLAGGLTWWRQEHRDALAGAVTTTATGSQTDALLVPAALVGLAGFGAALATTGVLRRLVGLVLAAGGAATAAVAVAGARTAPARLVTSLARPAESSSAPELQPAGIALGALGAVLLAAAGLLMTLQRHPQRRTLGSRYDAPTSRRTAAAQPTGPDGRLDPVTDVDAAAQWWKALDAGRDPTERAAGSHQRTAPTPPRTLDTGMSDDVPAGG